MKIRYRDWIIEADSTFNKKVYASIEIPSAEGCGCSYCLNYAASRENIFPKEIQQLFADLGIDKQKEIAVDHMTELENDLHYYWGWFQFKGKFKGADYHAPLQGGGHTVYLEKITGTFEIGFAKAISSYAFDVEDDIVQVEFACQIPWIIDTPPEGT
ncbi:MAG: hypothetical protein AAGI23_06890 [Bacteroidota bacterium]